MESIINLTFERYRFNVPFLILIVLLSFLLLVQGALASGLGGFVSEKLMSRTGITSSDLLIGREGVSGPSIDIGMGPSVSTLGAAGVVFEIGHTVATLNGNVASLNGFPSSDVWFEWGYTPGTLTNVTPVQTVVAPGNASATISGFAPGTVYYRFVGCDDGTNYGGINSFASSGAVWTTFTMTQVVLFIWIGIVILMVSAGLYSGAPLIPTLVVGTVLVVVGTVGVGSILGALRSWWGG